jgi:hypothetical protein
MEADIMDEDIKYAANDEEETVLTEDELVHQLYGVDNDIEVSISAVETKELLDEEEIYDEIEVEELTLEQPEESILQYTDKDGNTFEAIEFHNAAVESSLEPTPEEYKLYEADLNTLETKKIDKKEEANFDLDFTSTTDAEDNESVADFF